jgi:hypothetical protein
MLAASPYVVTGEVALGGSPAPVLTIQPGVIVKFNAGTTLKIGFQYLSTVYHGVLQAVGTPTMPITFTANTASPTAGYWQGIQFYKSGASASQVSFATVRYGGIAGNFGGLRTIDSSPTFDNVTVRDSAHSGMSCEGTSSPSLSNSTLTANSIGLYIWTPSAPSLQTVTFSSNSGYAISQDAQVTFGAVSGVTATGNGKDAIEVRNGIDANTTWKNLGIPYVCGELVIGKPAPPYPVLTIEPGVTVKFNSGGILKAGFFYFTQPYPGVLQAIGTAALPITFTANTATPAPGFWQGVQFYDPGASPSRMSYASVNYGGFPGNFGGVHLTNNASPVFDHVRFQSNSYAGISTSGSNPVVRNCDFTNNTAGLVNLTPSTLIDARFN